jgi:hypothetical protein
MSANMRLFVLIGAPMVLLVITLALVPYRIDEHFINRRTGVETFYATYMLLHRSEDRTRDLYNLQQYGELTAPDEWLLISKKVYLFPWSRSASLGHWLSEEHLNNWHLKMTITYAFVTPAGFQAIEKTLTTEAYSMLLAQRLLLWNALQVTESIDHINQQLDDENDQLFPGVRDRITKKNTITTIKVIKKFDENKEVK